MDDLVKELRNKGAMLLTAPPQPNDRLRAADEIERLRTALYLADEGCNYTSLYNEAHEVAKIKADIAPKEQE